MGMGMDMGTDMVMDMVTMLKMRIAIERGFGKDGGKRLKRVNCAFRITGLNVMRVNTDCLLLNL